MIPLLLALLPALAQEPPPLHVTKHYEILAGGVDGADTGTMLEQLHVRLTAHFGRAPEGMLRLHVYPTREAWAAGLRADQVSVPEHAGGYYAPATKRAYLYVQPSEYFTRQLILHEATHQFHWQAATGNRGPAATWYAEGLAEYFGMHDWDGRTLRTGVVPAITLEDYPERALKGWDALKMDVGLVIGSRKMHGRPECWALIHYLLNNHEKPFKEMAAQLDGGKPAADAWNRTFGRISPEFTNAFRAWMARHPQPWKVVWIEWQQRGDALEGFSDVNAIAVLKSAPARLTADLETLSGKPRAGLIFGYVSPEEFHVVQITAGGAIKVVARRNDEWRTLWKGKRTGKEGAPRLSLARSGVKVTVFVDGEEIGSYEVPGDVGLNVDDGRVRFHIRE